MVVRYSKYQFIEHGGKLHGTKEEQHIFFHHPNIFSYLQTRLLAKFSWRGFIKPDTMCKQTES